MSGRLPPAIMAAVCLPWTEGWELDAAAFRRLIRRLISGRIEHLYLFGTAGEGYAVTTAQFEAAARLFVEATAGDPVGRHLGVIGLSLPQVQERIEIGRRLGINSFQISFPAWGRLSDAEVDEFFLGTCGKSPACSFLFYNVDRGLRILEPAELHRLSLRYENLVAVKWAVPVTGEDLVRVAESAPLLTHFVSDLRYCDASLAGARCGMIVALSAVHLGLAREVFDLGQRRDNDQQLRTRQRELQRHRELLHSLHLAGGPMDGVFDKLYCRLVDEEFPLRLLPPYLGASVHEFERYRTLLQHSLPHWAAACDPAHSSPST